MLRVFAAVLLAMLATLQYRLWLDEGSLLDTAALAATYERQRVDNERARMRNERQQHRIWLLRQGPEGYETLARYQLGLVGAGEHYYRIVPE